MTSISDDGQGSTEIASVARIKWTGPFHRESSITSRGDAGGFSRRNGETAAVEQRRNIVSSLLSDSYCAAPYAAGDRRCDYTSTATQPNVIVLRACLTDAGIHYPFVAIIISILLYFTLT